MNELEVRELLLFQKILLQKYCDKSMFGICEFIEDAICIYKENGKWIVMLGEIYPSCPSKKFINVQDAIMYAVLNHPMLDPEEGREILIDYLKCRPVLLGEFETFNNEIIGIMDHDDKENPYLEETPIRKRFYQKSKDTEFAMCLNRTSKIYNTKK